MLREDFAPAAPGELVGRLATELAFVPNRLPPELGVDWSLVRPIEEARAATSELVGQARLTKNIDLIINAFARREALLSSRMEGTQTEIEELLLRDALPKAVLAEDTDLHEVLNYLATLDLAQSWLADGRQLDVSLVKELHARLLLGVRGASKSPGAFRPADVWIGRHGDRREDARFVPPPMEQVPPLVDDLVAFTMAEPVFGPLVDSAIAHYQFETIHPFQDGNGRLGRLLIPLHLMEWKVLDRPLIYLGPYFESHQDRYRDGLLAVSRDGAWIEWIRFFLEAIRATAVDARNRVQRMMTLEADYRERVIARSTSRFALPALDVVFGRVFVSVGSLEEHLGVRAPTAKGVIDTFVDLKILQPYRRVRGRQTWFAAELLEQVYADG